MMLMVEKSGAGKAGGFQLLRGCQPFLQVDEPQTPEKEEGMLKFPYRRLWGRICGRQR